MADEDDKYFYLTPRQRERAVRKDEMRERFSDARAEKVEEAREKQNENPRTEEGKAQIKEQLEKARAEAEITAAVKKAELEAKIAEKPLPSVVAEKLEPDPSVLPSRPLSPDPFSHTMVWRKSPLIDTQTEELVPDFSPSGGGGGTFLPDGQSEADMLVWNGSSWGVLSGPSGSGPFVLSCQSGVLSWIGTTDCIDEES
jgi:hypothetical protein